MIVGKLGLDSDTNLRRLETTVKLFQGNFDTGVIRSVYLQVM